jgi:RNA polymerase sigma factor (sigma-70 family)
MSALADFRLSFERDFLQSMEPHELLEASLPVVDRVTAMVCRRARLFGDEAEDFAADVRLALAENDTILRDFAGRSSLATYLTIVVQRLLADHRMKRYGRWHPSAEAVRLGEAAVMIETLVLRDRRPLEEALPLVIAKHGGTASELRAMLDRLPVRLGRPRLVELDDENRDSFVATERADDRTGEREQQQMSANVSRVVREALGALSLEDRMLVRFRFGRAMSIADISRMMRLPQRPLYRRLEALLERLRRALAAHHIDARDAASLIGTAAQEMDFGLDEEAS